MSLAVLDETLTVTDEQEVSDSELAPKPEPTLDELCALELDSYFQYQADRGRPVLASNAKALTAHIVLWEQVNHLHGVNEASPMDRVAFCAYIERQVTFVPSADEMPHHSVARRNSDIEAERLAAEQETETLDELALAAA